MSLFDKIFRDKDGKLGAFQLPNTPLLIWGLATVGTHVLRGSWNTASGYLAFVAITVWACLEIATGKTWFRRGLGAAVLVVVLVARF